MIDGDDPAVRRLAEQMGYIHPGNSEEYIARILNIIRLASEPVIQENFYDFGASTVFTRGREAGLEIFFDDIERVSRTATGNDVPAPQTGRLFPCCVHVLAHAWMCKS